MPIPDSVEGYELDEAEAALMRTVWPEGEDAAAEVPTSLSRFSTLTRLITSPSRPVQVLRLFIEKKPRSSQLGAVSPLDDGAPAGDPKKDTRYALYAKTRNQADRDNTSRTSCVSLLRPLCSAQS